MRFCCLGGLFKRLGGTTIPDMYLIDLMMKLWRLSCLRFRVMR